MSRSIPLTQGKFAIVDDADYDVLSQHKWFLHSGGYAVRNRPLAEGRGIIYMHRVIAAADASLMVDHIDGDKLNNCRANLRICTNLENQRNRKPRPHVTYKGVRFDPERNKWRARIVIAGREQHLGRFDDPESAARAYDAAAVEHFGEFARLNFPNERRAA